MENKQKDVWSKIVAKAWSDPSYKERLLKNPNQVLKEEGMDMTEGVTIVIHENKDNVLNLILPKKRTSEITEEVLSEITGGFCMPPVCQCR